MKKFLLSYIFLIFLLLSLVVVLHQSQTKQEIRKQAAVSGGVGKITLSPQTAAKYAGESFPVTVNAQTGTDNSNAVYISGLSFRLTYPYSGISPQLEVVDQNGNSSSRIYPNTSLTDWNFAIKSVTRANGLVTIDFAAFNQTLSGFKSTTPTPLATIYFKVNQATANPVTLTFDLSQTFMLQKGTSQDVLDTPVNGLYVINPSPTPTPTSTPTPTPSPTPTPTPIPTIFNFGFKMQAVTTPSLTKTIELMLKNSSTTKTYSVNVQSDANAIFKPANPVTLSELSLTATGTVFDVFVKEPYHLRKKLGSMTLTSGNNIAPDAWQNQVLLAGDFDNNNVLNIFDVSSLLDQYTSLSVPVNDNNRKYDVNADNVINIFDIAYVLDNYTSLTVSGD